MMLTSPNVKTTPLSSVKPFVVSKAPIEDESLVGYVSRSLADTAARRMIVGLGLAGIGTLSPEHLPVTLSDDDQICSLAKLLGTTPEEVSSRLFHIPGDKPSRLVNFYGVPIRELYREYRFRRVSPSALRRSAHYRAIWDIRFLSFDPETLEFLRDSCPECGKKLDWNRSYGIGNCNNCLDDRGVPRVDLRDYDSPVLEMDDVEALRLAPALLSPVSDVWAEARAKLAEPWRNLSDRDVIEALTSITFMISGGNDRKWTFAPPRRDDFDRLRPEDLARAGRMMLDGHRSLSDLVKSMRRDIGGDSDIRPSEVFGELATIKNNAFLSQTAIGVFEDAMSAELRSRPYVRSPAEPPVRPDGKVRADLAGRKLGFSTKQINRLIKGGHVPYILSGYRDAEILVDPRDMDTIAAELEASIVDTELAEKLNITEGCIPLLAERGFLERSSNAINAAFGRRARFQKQAGLSLVDRILDEVPKSSRFDLQCVEQVLSNSPFHQWRTGAALVTVHDFPSEFLVQAGPGSWLSRVLVPDVPRFEHRLDGIPKDLEWLDTHKAADILSTGYSVVAALVREKKVVGFNARGHNKVLLMRKTVDEFAASYMLGGQVMALCGSPPPAMLRQQLERLGLRSVGQLTSKRTLIFNRQEVENTLRRKKAIS